MVRAPIGPDVLARKKFGTNFSAVSSPAPLMLERKKAFHSTSLAETASASDDAMMPVKRFTLWRSTISCALRTQLAGLPCVSSKRNSTLRPRMPPRSSTSFWTSLHVRTTCAPSAAHVPVIAVGTPMRMGPLPCAHARLMKAGAPTTAAAAPVVTRNSRLLPAVIAVLLYRGRSSYVNVRPLLYHESDFGAPENPERAPPEEAGARATAEGPCRQRTISM